MKKNNQIMPASHLAQAINGMGQVLNAKCNKYGGGIVFVCVLKGGFMFFSDLVKKIKYPIKIDFIQCKSYHVKKQGDIKKNKNSNKKIIPDHRDRTVSFWPIIEIFFQVFFSKSC